MAGVRGAGYAGSEARGDQDDFGLFATALIGTRTKPRLSAALAHAAMRSIEAGTADAMPAAAPRSRAAASSRASALSTCAAVGTPSRMTSAFANGRLLAPAICGARLRGDEPSST